MKWGGSCETDQICKVVDDKSDLSCELKLLIWILSDEANNVGKADIGSDQKHKKYTQYYCLTQGLGLVSHGRFSYLYIHLNPIKYKLMVRI